MAIERGDDQAMHNLGYYHYTITKNYEEAEKYWLMGIEYNSIRSANMLIEYHKKITKDREKQLFYGRIGFNLTQREFERTGMIYLAENITSMIPFLHMNPQELEEYESQNQ